MNEQKTYYITTPIYYPSDNLHIGHTYCTVATDALARYKRLQGYNVMFLTGTDEHGQKIENKAKEAGVTPQQFVDSIVEGPRGVKALWKLMNISNDRFIRTTDGYHVAAIQRIFKKMYENGDIYKGTYSGKYCTPCESFWTESQLVNGMCPDCGRPVVDAEEEAYFFRASKYADRIRDLLLNTDFLEPRSRVNEMINNFIDCEGGLQDLCVSRTSFTWGIPVDFDPGHVVYVWLDALFNYVTALGYCNDAYHDLDTYWPGVNIVGKEIVRFHSIYWPAFLMSVGLPLPKKVYGHGWLNFNGEKMSKSRGNVVDPYLLAERYGVDALRFFLLRTFPFGADGNFSNELLIQTINTDLANDLGNLVSRTVAMVHKYFDGVLPAEQADDQALDGELTALAGGLRERYEAQMEKFQLQNALAEVFKVVSRANKYIDETMPWALAKNEADRPRLASVLYHLCEVLRIVSVLLTPFLPSSAEAVEKQLHLTPEQTTWQSVAAFGALPRAAAVEKGEALFPRIDVEKELAVLEEMTAAKASAPARPEKVEQPAEGAALITFDDFMRVRLTVMKVTACEPIPKAKKLLKLILDDGSGVPRTVASGIAPWYQPDQLIGRQVAVVANLKPAVLCGVESQGMILAADCPDGRVQVLFVDDLPLGSRLR